MLSSRVPGVPLRPSFGSVLWEIRWLLKKTQRELATSASISVSAISQYESGKRVPRAPIFRELETFIESELARKPLAVQKRARDKLALLRDFHRARPPGRPPGTSSGHAQCVRNLTGTG
jgi:transcriptional regulator with XRE-family HTH domain